eukprot:1202701-Pyramimonas_sp.AAC.1
MVSKTAEDSLRCVRMAPEMLQGAPRLPQDGSKMAYLIAARGGLQYRKSFEHLKKTNDCYFFVFSLSMAIRGLKMTPRGPKRASRAPHTSLDSSTRLGVVSGWACGDLRSVKNGGLSGLLGPSLSSPRCFFQMLVRPRFPTEFSQG